MISKNLFFKLLREQTKQRIWLIALMCLVSFFAFPVAAALMSGAFLDMEQLTAQADRSAGLLTVEMCRNMASQELIEEFQDWISPTGPLLLWMIPIAAAVGALAEFSFLHSRRKTDFYHSLPVKREILFAVSYVGGILYVAVPYVIGLLAAGLMIQIKVMPYSVDWGTLLTGVLQGIAFFILSYSAASAAAILTGNIVVSILGIFVFFFWGPLTVFLVHAYCQAYFTFFYQAEGILSWLSVSNTSPVFFYWTAGANAGGRALGALAAGAVIGAAAMILYRKRPSEAAGRAMAFSLSQPLFKIILTVPGALGFSLFFYEMRGSFAWGLFGLFCGVLIMACVIEIIYHFDVRRAFAGWKSTAVGAAAALSIFCLFFFDLAGYDSYLPEQEKIESVGVSSYLLYGNLTQDRTEISAEKGHDGQIFVIGNTPGEYEVLKEMEISDEEAVQAVLEIAEKGISRKNRIGGQEETEAFTSIQNGDGEMTEENVPEESGQVLIQYHLKNGSTATRVYWIDLLDVKEASDRLYASADFKKESYPVFSMDEKELAGANFHVFDTYSHIETGREELAELFRVYQEEFLQLTADERREEVPLGYIQFKTESMQNTIDQIRAEKGDYTRFNDFAYYPVYPSFERTVSLLREADVKMADSLKTASIDRAVVEMWIDSDSRDSFKPYSSDGIRTYLSDSSMCLEVTEPSMVDEILDNVGTSEDPLYRNCVDESMEVVIYVQDGKDGEVDSFRLRFKKGQIPGFVEEQMGAYIFS